MRLPFQLVGGARSESQSSSVSLRASPRTWLSNILENCRRNDVAVQVLGEALAGASGSSVAAGAVCACGLGTDPDAAGGDRRAADQQLFSAAILGAGVANAVA